MPIVQQGGATTSITGTWNFPNGLPVANGTVVFKLNQDALVTGAYQVAPATLEFPLDANGVLNGMIIGNDKLLPAFTTYTVTVKEKGGGQVWGPEVYYLTGVSLNLNVLAPLQLNQAFTPIFPVPGYAAGAAVSAANFALTGWGAGAFISNIVGVQQRCSIMVTAGTGGTNQPNVTFTYPGAYASASFNLSEMIGGTGMVSDVTSLSSVSQAVFTYGDLPIAGLTYIFVFDTIGI